jgi:hypothetical protein
VGGILANAGIPEFLANMEILLETDEGALQWENFLSELRDYYRDEYFAPGAVATLLRRDAGAFTLPDSFSTVDMRRDRSLETALGKSFTKRIGARFGEDGLFLERSPDRHAKQASYRVLETPKAEPSQPLEVIL